MALSSPRFRGVTELEQAAHNAPWLSVGSKGYGVHLVQMALIDLGYAMPNSTGGVAFSPDGIYGAETKSIVREFQKTTLGGPAVNHDGAIGQNTMRKLDHAMLGHTRRVHLQVSFTSKPSVPIETQLKVARDVFERYGIAILHVPVEGFFFEHDADQGFFNENPDFEKQKERLKDRSKLTLGPTDIAVAFIDQFATGRAVGDSQWDASGALIRITEKAFETTLAHELGHVLLSPTSASISDDHSSHDRNIMLDGFVPRPPHVLSAEQLKRMKSNARCL